MFDGQDEGLLSPSSPQDMPLNPTDQSASVEMWIRPSRLDGGRQVLLSFGGKTDRRFVHAGERYPAPAGAELGRAQRD